MSANPIVQPPANPPSPSKTVDDLAAEQGVGPLDRFDDLFGAGRELWTEAEFAAFLEQVKAARREEA
jgi:hypothetical protein